MTHIEDYIKEVEDIDEENIIRFALKNFIKEYIKTHIDLKFGELESIYVQWKLNPVRHSSYLTSIMKMYSLYKALDK